MVGDAPYGLIGYPYKRPAVFVSSFRGALQMVDARGERRSGERDADSPQALATALEAEG